MIPKIVWPHTSNKGNPFGGKDGFRPLSITFHSKIFEEIPQEEAKALEILYEISKPNKINVMSFDGKIFPKIVFGNPNDIENSDIRALNENDETLFFHAGITPSHISKDEITRLMRIYSSNRQSEFDEARDELIQVEAHNALGRDIFVTASTFLLKNRDELIEHNIRSPLEALKVVGLYIRNQNEYEWFSEVNGNVRSLASNRDFFNNLVRGLLPNNWRFLKHISAFLKNEDERFLGISVLNRCSSALQARDELAKLFYMPEKYSSSDERKYHFDYLTLLLTGALDALALILNRVYNLQLDSNECSLSPSRKKYKKKLSESLSALKIFEFVNSDSTQTYLEILYLLRNRIHSISLDETISVPRDAVDALLEKIYNYDDENHWGMTKQKVMASINGSLPAPYYDIKINKYYLAVGLLNETFGFIDRIMDLVTPQNIIGNPPSELLRYIERYKYLG